MRGDSLLYHPLLVEVDIHSHLGENVDIINNITPDCNSVNQAIQ